jgi:hypothetical protein
LFLSRGQDFAWITVNGIGTLADGSGAGRVAAFWAAVGCGAEIVAAAWAEAGAIPAAGAEDGAKAEGGEDGEEEGGEPVGEPDEPIGLTETGTAEAKKLEVSDVAPRERTACLKYPALQG